MKLALYCTCGAAWMMNVQGPFTEDAFREAWDEDHTGLPGHAPCDAKTAARARARAERKEREHSDYLGGKPQ